LNPGDKYAPEARRIGFRGNRLATLRGHCGDIWRWVLGTLCKVEQNACDQRHRPRLALTFSGLHGPPDRACLERAADPSHSAGIDPEPLGDLTHARACLMRASSSAAIGGRPSLFSQSRQT
jgi:hypothetical protein